MCIRDRSILVLVFMEDLTAVDTYLRKGEYPTGLSKGEKANLRRRCRNNFKLQGELLYYKKAHSTAKDGEGQSEWKICVMPSVQ